MVAFEYNRQSRKDGEKARKDGAYKQMEETRYREQLEACPSSQPAGAMIRVLDALPVLQVCSAVRRECMGTYYPSMMACWKADATRWAGT